MDDGSFMFNRMLTRQTKEISVVVSMEEYRDKIHPIALTRSRWIQHEDLCAAAEGMQLQELAGQLNFLGHGILSTASLVASTCLQNVSRLKVKHLQESNSALKQFILLRPELRYPAPISSLCLKVITSNHMSSFSNASTETSSYEQTGYIAELFFPNDKLCTFHVWDRHSGKQSRVSFFSFGAELLAAAESDDRSLPLSKSVALIVA